MTAMRSFLPALAVLLAAPATWAVTETEKQTVFEHSWVILNKDTEAAQTFRIGPGNAGAIARVAVHISAAGEGAEPTGVLHVELCDASGGVPGEVLAARTYDIDEDIVETTPRLLTVDFPQPVAVSVDDELALVLRITEGVYFFTRVAWAGSDTDEYPDGEAMSRTAGGAWTTYGPDHEIDRHFVVYNE